MRKTSWTDEDLIQAVAESKSVRRVIFRLGLIPAGGNYVQVNWRIKELGLDTSHFTGMGWNVGERYRPVMPPQPLKKLLVKGSRIQSYKLKLRLFAEGKMEPKCQWCGWSKETPDGRVPVELDHMNGDKFDNRLENLRILCPNCHSMTSTYRHRKHA